MAEDSFDEDLKSVLFDFEQYPELLLEDIKVIVESAGIAIKETAVQSLRSAKEDSVEGLPWRNQSGQTRASITRQTKFIEGNVTAIVGTNKQWGLGLELGTTHTKKHPVFIPALNKNAPIFIEQLKKAAEGKK